MPAPVGNSAGGILLPKTNTNCIDHAQFDTVCIASGDPSRPLCERLNAEGRMSLTDTDTDDARFAGFKRPDAAIVSALPAPFPDEAPRRMARRLAGRQKAEAAHGPQLLFGALMSALVDYRDGRDAVSGEPVSLVPELDLEEHFTDRGDDRRFEVQAAIILVAEDALERQRAEVLDAALRILREIVADAEQGFNPSRAVDLVSAHHLVPFLGERLRRARN